MPARVRALAGDSTMTNSRSRDRRAEPLPEVRLVALRFWVVDLVVLFVGIRGAMSSGIHTVLLYGNLSSSHEAHRSHLAHHTL